VIITPRMVRTFLTKVRKLLSSVKPKASRQTARQHDETPWNKIP
jgi:hypothetical protein